MPAGHPALLSAVSRGSHKAVDSTPRALCWETGLEICQKEFSSGLKHCCVLVTLYSLSGGTKTADLSLFFQVACSFLSLVLLLDSLVSVKHTIDGWILSSLSVLDALCTHCSLLNVREQVQSSKTGKSTGCRAHFWKHSFLAVKLIAYLFHCILLLFCPVCAR